MRVWRIQRLSSEPARAVRHAQVEVPPARSSPDACRERAVDHLGVDLGKEAVGVDLRHHLRLRAGQPVKPVPVGVSGPCSWSRQRFDAILFMSLALIALLLATTGVAVMTAQPDTTQLLRKSRGGDRDVFNDLYAQVYDTLREIAHQRLVRHQGGATLGTTALVHEAYLRLVDHAGLACADRAHFFALASRAMRFVLVDYARERTSLKRGGGHSQIPLDDVQIAADERAIDLLALTDALDQMASVSTRLSDIVDYRFFGGLTFDEIAEVTGRSVPTVKRDWARARAWLYRSMHAAAHAPL